MEDFMAAKFQPCIVLYLFFLCFISAIPISSQSNSPQNIETLYPFDLPPIAPTPNSTNNQPISPLSAPPKPPPSPPLAPPPQPPSNPSSKKAVVKAVVATAASTILVSGLFFFLLQRHKRRRRDKGRLNSNDDNHIAPHREFMGFNGNLKGVIVDEEGLDVLYWRRLERGNSKNFFNKEVFGEIKDVKEEEKKVISKGDGSEISDPRIQGVPLLRIKSLNSQNKVWLEVDDSNQIKAPAPIGVSLQALEKQDSSIRPSTRYPQPPPPPPLPLPLPPKTGVSASPSSKPPPLAPKGMRSTSKKGQSSSGESTAGNGNGQVKLKPLHWDKMNPNSDHSMVWDKIGGGSFSIDDDLMEALFGSVATKKNSPRRDSNSTSPRAERSGPPSQIFILDIRKSQNAEIVLRSLAISRKEIIDALLDGKGLNADTLEKLTKIAPTKEEESEILAFDGDPTRLADAESFLYHLLKAVPSAFTRFNAMLFRSNYSSEILQLKDSLQSLELGCKELRTHGIFLKLLEAILKAGNIMNAGTSRGNAQAFDLSALTKLSDVKSTDGKTTLLHFVVEEVVRAEGKRCLKNRGLNSDTSILEDEREKEYIMLGLTVVGGISVQFSNVKKAAELDYGGFTKSFSALTDRIAEIKLMAQRAVVGGGFVREIKGFLGAAEEEIRVVRAEQTRVMELVKKTTEYYQAGSSKDKGAQLLQLFVIVKDFLGMVDQVCVNIARNLQKRKTSTASGGSSSPKSPGSRTSVKFPILPASFMSDK